MLVWLSDQIRRMGCVATTQVVRFMTSLSPDIIPQGMLVKYAVNALLNLAILNLKSLVKFI